MSGYKHILLVTDLREDCGIVAEAAKQMLDNADTHLSVLHIVEETVLTAGYEIVPIVPVGDESELTSQAQKKLKALLDKHGLQGQIHIDTALSTRRGILDYAETVKPDLIVIGRHKRSGLASLLGATADDILPAVECDVLVVRLGKPV
ncbi:universal stress protein [Suttonella ornithocola]|uniref:Universal stress protein n=1 Tax=Suttonella ornithocola TaxID=279832 RepID=A0A380MPN8_9GAMM|nr:universal stress protein [Suttonella ornithocola]SUO93671.1 Universal stress protein A homolog 2 [Suttonella ornithocola]